MNFIMNISSRHIQVQFPTHKNAKKEFKVCKKTKLGKTTESPNQHFNSANWQNPRIDQDKFCSGQNLSDLIF